ncbi:MAG: CDP-alcohol phosphatidyltransferase family protein [Cellvibrio sp.]|uniref:CDP-alcohol phosphatidyltransferase family protein n=1 Tax=Cellvibrio sp. TaxID=1965322 RepID=UPI0027292B4A|nr:CDP-alcohol phosphatidyltransferase family protein [Cellvibrio sp.]
MRSPIKHEVLLVILLGIATLIAGFFTIRQFTPLDSLQWLLIADCLWVFVCWQLWQRLELNRAHQSAPLYTKLGWANHVTLFRGGLIALTGGFLFQPQAEGWAGWIPGVLYTLAAILDRMDGFVARRGKQTSLLGSELDTVYDALGLLVAPLLAVGYGKIHWSFLLVSAAYYVFVWGLYWRRTHNLPVYPLMPSLLRRTLAGFQMGFVAFILLPCFYAPLTIIIGIAFMLPILLGFIVDWLVVSGRIQSSATNAKLFNHLAQISHTVFQPLLRLVLFIALLLLIHNDNILLPTFLTVILLVVATMTLFGLAGRIGALIAVVLVTFSTGDNFVDVITATIIFTGAWLMLLGTGRFSLWQWDDRWVNRRDGEEHS